MNIELNSVERGNRAAEWLAGLMLRRDNRILPRFVCIYRELQQRPRRWRRLLRRRLALTLTGAALLLALAGGPVATSVLAEPIDTSANIAVVDGEVAISDNGQCSLMEAIINAQATQAGQMFNDCKAGKLNGPDTVSLPHGGSFELTADYDNRFGPTGLPVITAAVTIEGHGSTIRRRAAGTPEFRILAVDSDGDLTLRDTTISNGSAYYYEGGGIYSKGGLTIEGSTISDNYATRGGGISAEQATITGSVVSDNWTYGVSNHGSWGGGITATTLVVEDSTISGNRSGDGGGISAGQATITGSRIVDNEAYFEYLAEGGGIQASVLTLTDSVVAGNTADGGVDTGGHGGGIHMGSGAISGSTISGNEAEPGVDGGIQGYPQPGKGGGVMATGAVTIVNSTFSDNEANEGGGLFVLGETTLIHSTLSGNNARTDTGGPNGQYQTVGGKGGGVLVAAESSTCGALTASGNLISGNTAAEPGRELLAAQDQCAAAVTTDAFNVFGRGGDSGTAGFTPGASDVVPTVGLSAILSPAAGNGGPTQTFALPAGSPALDLAPNASCVAAPVDGVDQRGEPRGANGAGGASANECDAGSFELQPGGAGVFLISPAKSGSIGGLAFRPSDILRYDPATGWSIYFDGSDVGIDRNLSAFEVLDNGDVLMSFAGNQRIPGVAGALSPRDIARFVPTAVGEDTAGTFHLALRGSDNLLTTAGERIDALADTGDGRWAISTTGTASVRLPDGTPLKAQDEDALGLNPDTGQWSALFDGTAVPGLRAEDVNAMWIDPATGDIYIGLAGAFNLSGIKGNGRDIVKLTPSGALGGYTPSLWWDGSAAGFPVNIDGLEILR